MRIKRTRKDSSSLTPDQVQHLVQGWCIDPCTPYFGTPGYPFQSDEQRRRRWNEHRAELPKTWGPVKWFQGWYDYEASPAQREAFDIKNRPNVWGSYSQNVGKVAEVIPIPVGAEDD